MRWNPFKRAVAVDAADSRFETTEVDDVAAARLAGLTATGRPGARPPPGMLVPAVATSPIAETESIGHVGRYALKSVLGVGGLGTVYAAWDPLLSRSVALKTLHIDTDPASRQVLDALFLNEARAAAGLSHAHIVTVHDAGPSANGVYIAMERLQGQDLRHQLQQGDRPGPLESAQIVRRVAEALSYAHRKGVVHCDIKPANIFMIGRGNPKVLDFGIARIVHRENAPAPEGVVAGSPYYLAPEQVEGHTVDRRSDVYSLGVVLYELLAGRRPFEGNSLEEIATAVKGAEVVPAHRVSPRVPAGLSAIAARAMARDPADRFPSARHLSMELRHWFDSAEARPLLAGARPGAVVPSFGLRVSRVALPLAALGVLAGIWWERHVVKPDAARPLAVASAPAASARTAVAGLARDTGGPAPASAGPGQAAAGPATPGMAAPAAPAAAAVPPSTPAPVTPTTIAAEDAARTKAEAARKRRAQSVAETSDPARAVPRAALPTQGMVQLAVSPWGQIDVDGRPMGISPPLTRLTLSAGAHTITVRNADFPAFVTTVSVGGDAPVTLRHRFGP